MLTYYLFKLISFYSKESYNTIFILKPFSVQPGMPQMISFDNCNGLAMQILQLPPRPPPYPPLTENGHVKRCSFLHVCWLDLIPFLLALLCKIFPAKPVDVTGVQVGPLLLQFCGIAMLLSLKVES